MASTVRDGGEKVRAQGRVAGVAAAASLVTVLGACSTPSVDEAEVRNAFNNLRAVSAHRTDCPTPGPDDGACTIRVRLARDASAGDIAAAIEVGEAQRREGVTVQVRTTSRDGATHGEVFFSGDVAQGPVSEALAHLTRRPALGRVRAVVDGDDDVLEYTPRAELSPARVLTAAKTLFDLSEGMPLQVDPRGTGPALRVTAPREDWPTRESDLYRAAATAFPAVRGGIVQDGVVLVELSPGADESAVRAFLTGHPSYDASDAVLATADPRIHLDGLEPPARHFAVELARVLSRTDGWSALRTRGGSPAVTVDDAAVASSVHADLADLAAGAGRDEGGEGDGSADADGDGARDRSVTYLLGPSVSVELAPHEAPLFDLAARFAADEVADAFGRVSLRRRSSGGAVVTITATGDHDPRELGRLLATTWAGQGPVRFRLRWKEQAVSFDAARSLRLSPGSDLPARVLRPLQRGWREGVG